jgi:hypothetical protein
MDSNSGPMYIDYTTGRNNIETRNGTGTYTTGRINFYQHPLGMNTYCGQLVLHRTKNGGKKYYIPFAKLADLEQYSFNKKLQCLVNEKHLLYFLYNFWNHEMYVYVPYVPLVDIAIKCKGRQEPRGYMLAANVLKVDKLEPGETYPVIECHYVPSDDD